MKLLGLPLDRMTEAEAATELARRAQVGEGTWVITPNLDHLRRAHSDPALMSLLERADLRLADGMPLVWASRIMGDPLPERVAGSALVWSLSAELARTGQSLFLLGGDPGVAEQAAGVLTRRYQGLRIAGWICPPFGFEHDPAVLADIAARLRDANPDAVYVALSFPKQEQVIEKLRPFAPSALFIGIGISLSFITGNVPRAPAGVRRMGAEWLWRLAHEPRKLFKRYILHGLPFAVRLLGWSATMRAVKLVSARG